jgi:flagellar basal body L-ring protein FlgH
MIDVNDVSQMRFSMELKGKNAASVSSNPDVNITGFLPKVAADRSVDNTDNMTLSGRGNMKLEIAAVVGAPTAEGLFPLQGTREYRFNGASNLFTVTGLVAPAMLRGRRISSNNVLNFRLDVRGTRQGLNLPLQRNHPPRVTNECRSDRSRKNSRSSLIICNV